LLSDYLQQPRRSESQQLERLLQEQRRTNALLQILLYLGLGFFTSMLVLVAWSHFNLYS
jgi:ubiquinone biosynthesis protein